MQWVETTAKSIEEAKGLALDQLGVAEEDTEFEILEEPRSGLFGRIKGEARVRARVRPTAVRPKLERRDRKRGRDAKAEVNGDTSGESRPVREAKSKQPRERSAQPKGAGRAPARAAATAPATLSGPATTGVDGAAPSRRRDASSGTAAPAAVVHNGEETTVSAQQVGEEAKKFMTDLVAAFGLAGTVDLREDGDDLEVTVSGADLGLMVGPRGNTLLAVQDLARVASQRRLGDHDTRLRVDIGGYRERRKAALTRFATQIAEQVASSGEARALEPMPSADRKVIHDALTEIAGVVTRSEGDDPFRRIVIAPAND